MPAPQRSDPCYSPIDLFRARTMSRRDWSSFCSSSLSAGVFFGSAFTYAVYFTKIFSCWSPSRSTAPFSALHLQLETSTRTDRTTMYASLLTQHLHLLHQDLHRLRRLH